MGKISATLLMLAALGISGPALAQGVPGVATVVNACGTPPATYAAGQNRSILQNTNGQACTQSSFTLSGILNSNTAQVNGTTVDVGTGASGLGTQRVAVSSDSGLSFGPSSSASVGIAPIVAGPTSSGSILKASPGNLYSVYFTAGSTPLWGMVFNSTAVPSNGSTTSGIASGNLQDCIVIPANTTQSISYNPGPPEVFSVGITAAVSSTSCATLTLSATAFIHGDAK